MTTGHDSVTAVARYFTPVVYSDFSLLDPSKAESRTGSAGDSASMYVTSISVDDLRK